MDMTTIGNQYGHMALNLLGVLALIIVLMYILKRVKSSKNLHNRHIKVINSVAIGTKEKILLVEVNHILLLVGATPNHIETLHVFNESEQAKAAANEDQDLINAFSRQMAMIKESE